MESTTTQADKPIARPVTKPRAEEGSSESSAAATQGPQKSPAAASVTGALKRARASFGTYVADSFDGDSDATSGGRPVLAHDGEPAGLARITLAMRKAAPIQAPASQRLIGICAWAAAIGVIGVLIGIWAAIVQIFVAPGWFLPIAGLVGLAGVSATMGAFVMARQPRVPWILLAGASVTLIIAIVLTVLAS